MTLLFLLVEVETLFFDSSGFLRAKAHIISITYGPAKQLRECFLHHEPRVPHIWPGFGQMWELAALGPEVLKRNQHSRPSIR